MAKKTNRTCALCGTKYYYCPNCSEFYDKPTWMGAFCSERCHTTFYTFIDYDKKRISLKEAHDKVKNFDWSNIESYGFDDEIKHMILEDEKPTNSVVKPQSKNEHSKTQNTDTKPDKAFSKNKKER